MNDKELLELAAKAAKIKIVRHRLADPMQRKVLIAESVRRNPGQIYGAWNPLADDGDALRLAVKLRIVVQHEPRYVVAIVANKVMYIAEHEDNGIDPYAATRRAIVRAAAEIDRATTQEE